jgi:Calx-beta domain
MSVRSTRRIQVLALLAAGAFLIATASARAATLSDFQCVTGTAIPRTQMTILSATGGYFPNPVDDAVRLIDDTWNGWAPNLPQPQVATAVVGLGATLTLTEIQVFSDSTTGILEVRAGATGSWLPLNLTTAYQWHRLVLSGSWDRVELRRDHPSDNAIEFRACSGTAASVLAVPDASTGESASPLTFNVSLTPASATTVTVQYQTSGLTANAGLDYTAATGTLTFNPGVTSRPIPVTILPDTIVEGNHTFQLTLSSPTGGATIGDGIAIGTIQDDDGACTYNSGTNLQAGSPSQCGKVPEDMFGRWVDKLDATRLAGIGSACVTLHDRYWTLGPDNLAYHTWHPSSAPKPGGGTCFFGHEHGDDPTTSDAFAYSGGYPPLGFVEAHVTTAAHRHEDHFGHKVTVANNLRMAIGRPFDGMGPYVWDSGIVCDFLSKIHMGTYSTDALTNHLHEYFLTLSCNDTHQGTPTQFSVKRMVTWGDPNELLTLANYGVPLLPLSLPLVSEIKKPENDSVTDLISGADPAIPTGSGGSREFENLGALLYREIYAHKQPEMWAANINLVKTPVGDVQFAPYYITKNPSRILAGPAANPTGQPTRVIRTLDACYVSGVVRNVQYCYGLPQNYPGATYWKTTASPFNGGLRAVHFKGFGLKNSGGPAEWCTEVFGENPTALPCVGHQIRQKASSIRNYWQEQTPPPTGKCIKDITNQCRNLNLEGTLERSILTADATKKCRAGVTVTRGTLLPAGPTGQYNIAPELGFEWVINHCEDAGVFAPN